MLFHQLDAHRQLGMVLGFAIIGRVAYYWEALSPYLTGPHPFPSAKDFFAFELGSWISLIACLVIGH